MLKNKNRVAILMATYNSEKYINEQIESLISQSYTNWSLYIRDDGSIDNTINIISSYQHRYDNIFVLNADTSLGPKDSFMELLSEVESEYYIFCDHDDVWLSNKIQLFVQKIDSFLRIDENRPVIVCSDLVIVDENLNMMHPSFWEFSNFKEKDFNDFIFHWFGNNINGCSMLINNVAKCKAFPMPQSVYMHDSWIALATLANNGIVLMIKEPTMLYRQHNNTLGAKKVSFNHYITDIKGVLKRTYNQFLTVNTLINISFMEFIILKCKYRFF